MTKRKRTKIPDKETLKHYESYDALPSEGITGEEEEKSDRKDDTKLHVEVKQPHFKKLLDEAKASKAKFIKAEIEIDLALANRKSAVINIPPPENKDE